MNTLPALRGRASGFLGFGLTLVLYFAFATIFPVEPLFGLINLLLASSCLFLVFCATRSPYSLIQMFALASFVLLSVMPRIESHLGVAYWGGSTSVFQYYSLISMLTLVAVWLFFASWRLQQRMFFLTSRHQPSIISRARAIFVSAAAVVVILAYNGFSLTNVIFRDVLEGYGRTELPQIWWLLYSYFLYPMPSIVLILYLVNGPRNNLVLGLLFVLVLLGNPPTGMPRFQAAMLYLAILICCAPWLVRRPYFLALATFTGVFGIFPLLDAFRSRTSEVALTSSPAWIIDGHFDSMQNFARAVENDFVTWGWQLLGVLGFFIPRAMWPSKPVGSGLEVAGSNDFENTNISMNFLGEGYVNFGIPGVFVFALLLGLLFGRLDAGFWQGRFEGRALGVIYLLLIGGTFFLIRGDLLSSFAYLMGMAASVLVVHKLLTWQFTSVVSRGRPSLSALR